MIITLATNMHGHQRLYLGGVASLEAWIEKASAPRRGASRPRCPGRRGPTAPGRGARRDDARLSGAYGDLDDDPTDASNAILDLIRQGKLDEAETAARDLLDRYPEIHDGWDRLGAVQEARGERAQAIECYRRVIAFLDANPDYSGPEFRASFVDQIARLEAQTAQ